MAFSRSGLEATGTRGVHKLAAPRPTAANPIMVDWRRGWIGCRAFLLSRAPDRHHQASTFTRRCRSFESGQKRADMQANGGRFYNASMPARSERCPADVERPTSYLRNHLPGHHQESRRHAKKCGWEPPSRAPCDAAVPSDSGESQDWRLQKSSSRRLWARSEASYNRVVTGRATEPGEAGDRESRFSAPAPTPYSQRLPA